MVTFTLPGVSGIEPCMPETVIVDGYKLAGDASIMLIGAGFVKTAWGCAFSTALLAFALPCARAVVERDDPIKAAMTSIASSGGAAKILLYITIILQGQMKKK
jgi:hypothetical protein